MAKRKHTAARGVRTPRAGGRTSKAARGKAVRGTAGAATRGARRAAAGPDAATAPALAEGAAQEQRRLQARRVEDLAQAFVSLTSELWIVKDRMAVLEQVLDRHGIPAPAAVDAYVPEGEFKARLDAERRAWAQRMIAALFPRGLPKAD